VAGIVASASTSEPAIPVSELYGIKGTVNGGTGSATGRRIIKEIVVTVEVAAKIQAMSFDEQYGVVKACNR